jgi:hypothetical protein
VRQSSGLSGKRGCRLVFRIADRGRYERDSRATPGCAAGEPLIGRDGRDRAQRIVGGRPHTSRAAVAAVAGGVTFAVAGVLSGVLIDDYGGGLGALEWLLRTLVVIEAVLFIVAGALFVLGVRRRVG